MKEKNIEGKKERKKDYVEQMRCKQRGKKKNEKKT